MRKSAWLELFDLATAERAGRLLRTAPEQFGEHAARLCRLLAALVEDQRQALAPRPLGSGWTHGGPEALAAVALLQFLERLQAGRIVNPPAAADHLAELWGAFLEEGLARHTAAALDQSRRASHKRQGRLQRRAVQIAWDAGQREPEQVEEYLRGRSDIDDESGVITIEKTAGGFRLKHEPENGRKEAILKCRGIRELLSEIQKEKRLNR